MNSESSNRSKVAKQILSALFYASTSLSLTLVNKALLTQYEFPSVLFVSLGQMTSLILAVLLARLFSIIRIPPCSIKTFKSIWPLPLFYFSNLSLGLLGTGSLNLPMFTVLRRFSILFTMILESMLVTKKRVHVMIQISVIVMILGAIIAAINDFTFNFIGYFAVSINNLSTALNGVYTKKKIEAKELGIFGLMFYNALIMAIPAILLASYCGDFSKASNYDGWNNPYAVAYFLTSCALGVLLVYSTMLCTKYNTALATTIVGCLKNTFVTYFGMYYIGGYHFSLANFCGINMSVLGSLMYIYAKYLDRKKVQKSLAKTSII